MTRKNSRDRIRRSRQQTADEGDQPRPAFGLRPWFALLRRARSLRRFAFAIVKRRLPAERPYRPNGPVMLVAESWRSPPIEVATSFMERLVGVRRGTVDGVLIRSSSVHAVGIREPLRVVHLDEEGVVLHQDLLTAGRRVAARGSWILELPIGAPSPDPGARLIVLPCSVP